MVSGKKMVGFGMDVGLIGVVKEGRGQVTRADRTFLWGEVGGGADNGLAK